MANPVLNLRTTLRAWREDRLDRKIGGISLSEVRESRFQDLGAYPTMSAEYGAIEMMFRDFPLDANDVFVDVGCGFGRVISWLLLKRPRAESITASNWTRTSPQSPKRDSKTIRRFPS